ncbi:hypothetical protein B0H17DRAFT_1146373 [Mycena rosella]|uniref:Uncharacterized protein n=1 Tax=Mycena rosella TaxID=1033263 RepID=A0AAD7CPU1_MYCRO|nr:hypothetical protein B0H17DRAFT_1146373 [Mycena rosella]
MPPTKGTATSASFRKPALRAQAVERCNEYGTWTALSAPANRTGTSTSAPSQRGGPRSGDAQTLGTRRRSAEEPLDELTRSGGEIVRFGRIRRLDRRSRLARLRRARSGSRCPESTCATARRLCGAVRWDFMGFQADALTAAAGSNGAAMAAIRSGTQTTVREPRRTGTDIALHLQRFHQSPSRFLQLSKVANVVKRPVAYVAGPGRAAASTESALLIQSIHPTLIPLPSSFVSPRPSEGFKLRYRILESGSAERRPATSGRSSGCPLISIHRIARHLEIENTALDSRRRRRPSSVQIVAVSANRLCHGPDRLQSESSSGSADAIHTCRRRVATRYVLKG